jgi:hypothetical protein
MAQEIEGQAGGAAERKQTRRAVAGNRLALSNIPDPLLEWIKTRAEATFRSPEGYALFMLDGCMKKQLESKDKGENGQA